MTLHQLRSWVYTLLTVIAVAAVVARIGNAELLFEPSIHRNAGEPSPPAPQRIWPTQRPTPMPTFSSNDRSRWATVRALVDDGTFVIGQGTFDAQLGQWRGGKGYETGIVAEDGWGTIDRMMNPGTGKIYSTKPPLLTAVAAAEYGLLKHLLGWSITEYPDRVVKTIVITLNALPLIVYFFMLRRLLERFAASDWARLFVFSVACFGTFMTTFGNTLNNHTPAAIAALAAIYPLLMPRINHDDTTTRRKQLNGFLGAVVPSWLSSGFLQAGFFAGLTVCLELPAVAFAGLLFLVLLYRDPIRTLGIGLPAALAPIAVEFVINHAALGEWLPAYTKFGGPWYEYPGSHWLKPGPDEIKHGIDWARRHESIYAYWFHCLIGHHGLFSLTPVWLLSAAGLILMIRRADRPRFLAPFTLAVSAIVIGFYLLRSDNYGGWTSGLRWLIWLTPLWLVAMLPALDRLANATWGRRACYALLAVSVFSATYPAWNPWRHPWLYQFMEARGWVRY